jgi:hypothetical protein
MRHFFRQTQSLLLSNQVAFFLILLVAFVLRIYRLDTPSMWNDEIIVPVMGSKPIGYLLQWLYSVEDHPPTFYFFIKLVSLVSKSDFALRFPSMVLGLLSVFLMYHIGKTWLGEKGGLLAASFMAVSVPHIYFSRVVRFYSFAIVLCLLGVMLLAKFMERRDNRTLAWFATILGALLLAEYTSIMPIVALGLAMLAVILSGPGRLRLLWRFAVYGVAAFVVPGFFLLLTSIQKVEQSGQVSLRNALDNFLAGLAWLATGFEHRPSGNEYWIIGVAAALALVGALRLAFTNRRLLGICLSFVLCGLLVILLIRPGYTLAFWHLFYLIPVLALLGASAVQAVLPVRFQTAAALGISLAGSILILGPLHARFYSATAYDDDTREMGRAVASEVLPGSVTLLDLNAVDSVNWYADQFCLTNRLKDQIVTADSTPLTVNVFLCQGGYLGHLVNPWFPVSSWAEVKQERLLGVSSLVKAVVPRTPLHPLDFSGASQEFDAHPGRFYSAVYSAEKVMIYPYWGNMVIPTENEKPATFMYRFANPTGTGNKYIVLKIHYRNEGKDNVFKAWTQFDAEGQVNCVQSTGPETPDQDRNGDGSYVERVVSLRRERPFTTLTVGFALSCALESPQYPTSNLSKTGFKRLFVTARPYGPDLMNESTLDPDVELTGLKSVEHDGDRFWRWATGPRSGLSFTVDRKTTMRLTYSMTNPMKDQGYALTVNGEKIAEERGMPVQNWTEEHAVKVVDFTAKPGRNTIDFQFEKINHVNDSFSEADSSPYTVAFTALRLEPVPDAAR